MDNIPAIPGFDDYDQARPVYFQSGRAVHAPFDGTLAGLAGLDSTAGLVTQTGADAFTKRTLTTTANHLSITNPAGTAGNPLLELAVGPILTDTWTPTLTNGGNVAASTSAAGHYLRVGTFVWCFGQMTIDPTLAAPTITSIDISLPIASNFSAMTDLAGTGNSLPNLPGIIFANTVNDRASMQFNAQSVNNVFWSFSFGYRII